MLPDPWPTDGALSAALLARIVRSIDRRDQSAEDDLLAHMLWAAWPTLQAQDQ
jgi:hypothetical protein